MTSLQRDARVQEIAEAFAAIDRALPMSTTRREVSAAWAAVKLLRDQVAALQAENTRLESALAKHVHPVEEPIVTFSDGTALLRTDALTDDERAYHRKYGVLSPEAQQELRDFADHLARKKASRSPVPSEREGSNG